MLNIEDGKNNYLKFEKNFLDKLGQHDPKKIKIFRRNHKLYIIKILRKAIMKRSKLKNKANKTKHPKDILSIKRNVIMWLN